MKCAAHGDGWWCSREAQASSFCWAHYQQIRRTGRLTEIRTGELSETLHIRMPVRIIVDLKTEARRQGIRLISLVRRLLEAALHP